MPPVIVAEIKGVYYLLDGCHRIRALIQLHIGIGYVLSNVVSVKTVEETRWFAVKYNSVHGLYNSPEKIR
ncbi:MAG: ParB N-terminal domain-containing protein [Synergistaceae bacterium]|nr:ParB N-terminal domain-containing protein [Synergistaceae bacterium]